LLDFSILRRNLGLKLLAIFLAMFLWAYVKYSQTPYASTISEVKIKVPLTIEGKDPKLVVLDIPDEVTIQVKSSENISQISPRHFKAYIDLKDKKAGQYSVKVRVNSLPGMESVEVSPDSLLVRLDPEEKRLFNVKVKTQGTIAAGFILGVPSTKPESITVKGAQSILARVQDVQAVCDVDGADMDRLQQVEVEAVDGQGTKIDSLVVEPRFVRVSLHIKSEVVNAIVPIIPEIGGAPPKGYALDKITVKPMVASIRYPLDTQTPPQFMKTSLITLPAEGKDAEMEATLDVPKDIALVNPDKVKVIISFKKIIGDVKKTQ
jgi:YbbR domain-containing protein